MAKNKLQTALDVYNDTEKTKDNSRSQFVKVWRAIVEKVRQASPPTTLRRKALYQKTGSKK